MPGPFPGMDPWLERPAVFPNLHNSLITYLQAAINAALPDGYVVAGETRVYVDPELRRVPDVGVYGQDSFSGGGTATAVATLTAAGLLAVGTEPVSDPVEEPYLEIRTDDEERLVTAIEVVSPANKKPGEDGRVSYRQKQGEYRFSGANSVEIDLLRGGAHTTAAPEARLKALGCEYHVSVTVPGSPIHYLVAPIPLTARMPVIPIPLDRDVPPILVDLQAVFDRCYDEGGFAKRARYATKRPDPPLTPEQAAWAEGVLRAKGFIP